MYPNTESATDDRRQVDVDERHPDRTRDEQPDYEDQLEQARRAERHGDTPAGQQDYAADETTDPSRAAEHGEPTADQQGYAQPMSERGQESEYADPAYRQDQPPVSTGYAEPDRAERPSGDLREEGFTQRAPQPTDEWRLFGTEDAVDNLRSRWTELQGSFVDDPRQAVEQAEQLVSEVVQTVTDRFNERKNALATQSADTEELRLAMHRYRAFFRQLLGG